MEGRKVLAIRHYKAGYEVRRELIPGKDYGGPDMEMKSAYTPSGDYIGDPLTAHRLCARRGIRPEKSDPRHNVCSIGFSERDQKWYGWSHRAICGFGVGDTVSKGDCCATSGWTAEYLAEHPEDNRSLPVGFTASTLDDAKRMAIAFADAVG